MTFLREKSLNQRSTRSTLLAFSIGEGIDFDKCRRSWTFFVDGSHFRNTISMSPFLIGKY